MKLNHLDLLVPDVRAAAEFFERCFDLEICSNRSSPAIAILADRHGFTLVLQRAENPAYPEGFHIGFIVDDEDEVRRQHARLVAEGIGPMTDLIQNNRGLMFYCTGPGAVTIEVSCSRRAWGSASTPNE